NDALHRLSVPTRRSSDRRAVRCEPVRDELTNAIAQGANAFALASSKAVADMGAIDALASDVDPEEEMWAAITADIKAGLTDMDDLLADNWHVPEEGDQ